MISHYVSVYYSTYPTHNLVEFLVLVNMQIENSIKTLNQENLEQSGAIVEHFTCASAKPTLTSLFESYNRPFATIITENCSDMLSSKNLVGFMN